MHPTLLPAASAESATPILCITESAYEHWLEDQPAHIQTWLGARDFSAEAGKSAILPGTDGSIHAVLVIAKETPDQWTIASLPGTLPQGVYKLEQKGHRSAILESLALGWLLGGYRFDRYHADPKEQAQLVTPEGIDSTRIALQAEAVFLVRDLITTPPADMLPTQLAEAAETLAKRFNADYSVIVGDKLLTANYPSIHTVGRASADAPRLIDIRWGPEDAPKVTLVGKGVCFDSGGLDIKPSANMALMRKDMGGAAHVLGLAMLIMGTDLPVRLRVLVPAVENAISGNAFRTSDIIRTRKGSTVEVGNTDAEGRLILCDCLHEADSESPDLIIDCATLTGAARAAVGTDMPALFSNNDELARQLTTLSHEIDDPLWQLPLWQGYRPMLDTPYADISSTGNSPYGGAITAALFLHHFVEACPNWLHIDMMAWNVKSKPGRPAGGEAQGLRAMYQLIASRYAK